MGSAAGAGAPFAGFQAWLDLTRRMRAPLHSMLGTRSYIRVCLGLEEEVDVGSWSG